MKVIISLVLAAAVLIQCSPEEIVPEENDLEGCTTPATIRNFAGLDGCGYLLALNDGSILEPLKLVMCGPPPQSIMTLHDPLFDFQEDGLKVFIDYGDHEGVSACMAGKLVRITCITRASSSNADETSF